MQPNSKSINLEANILTEWYASDALMRRQLSIRFNLLIGVSVLALLVLPLEYSWGRRASSTAVVLHQRLAADQAVKLRADNLASAAKPIEQQNAMDQVTRDNVETLLGNLVLLMNATPTTVAMETLHAEAMDSALTIRCQCSAESFQAGQEFVKAAAQGPNVDYAVQSSTMKSSELTKPPDHDGIAFDFMKKVNLEP
jgi:hypothetical protein